MSTVSATQSYQTYAPPRPPSGRDRVSSAIGSEVSAGTISQTDATALTGALDAIDSSLSAARGTAAGGTSAGASGSGSTARLDPAQMKSRIDGLIDDQVSRGTLTSDQADTLKSLFAQHGPHGAGGAHAGSHAGPPPDADDDANDVAADAAGASADTGSGSGAASDLLAGFIQQLQTSQAGGYGAGGTIGSSQASALLFDFKA